MNILHFDYDDMKNPYAGGGQAVTTWEIYRRMKGRHTVTVVTGNYPNAKNETIDNITYRRIGLGNHGAKLSLLSFWLLIPWYVLTLQKRYDLIVEFFTAPFSVSLAPWVARTPILAWPTALFGKDLGEKYHSPFAVIERIGLKRYHYFVASTEEMKKDLRAQNPNANIGVVPYGFDKKLLTIKPTNGNYAIYVGRIDLFQKGVDLIVHAWGQLAKQGIRIPLVIVGNGKPEDVAKLNKLISDYNLAKDIILTGRLFGKKRDELVSKSLFVLCPSRYETYCIMALEALAMGKPLIYSDIIGFSWMPKHIGLSFHAGDAESLAQKCKLLLTSKDTRTAISKKAKSYAASYDWDHITHMYERMYASVVTNASAHI